MIYEAVNEPVLVRVPKSASRILDVGCGSGALGRAVKKRFDCEMVGVTHSEAEAELAAAHLDQVQVRDLNDFDSAELGMFHCIICSHVLEHLYQPERLLESLRCNLSPDGVLIVALPNVLHWRQRLEFLRGKFRYADGGLMDRTHYRFYDWSTARDLLTESGYSVFESAACGGFPLSRYLSNFSDWLDGAALRFSPGMFGTQFVFVCRPSQV